MILLERRWRLIPIEMRLQLSPTRSLGRSELNLGVHKAGFTIVQYYRPDSESSVQVRVGGGCCFGT